MLTRRALVGGAAMATLRGRPFPAFASPVSQTRLKASLRVFYNDDTTDLATNASPYHQRSDLVSVGEIASAVDEAVKAGVDTFVMQPGTGWVPWWTSAVYPADAHYRWIVQTYGIALTGVQKFVADGGDVAATYLKRCQDLRVPLIASVRLNDVHSVQFSGKSPQFFRDHVNDPAVPGWLKAPPIDICRPHMDNPAWRIDPSSSKIEDMIWNWAMPDAVAFKLALCTELVTRYDVDGIELDFMRYPRLFRDDERLVDRGRIVGNFVRAVRSALDQGRRGRTLTLRVPPRIDALAPLGLDPGALRGDGVDRLNVSSHTFTNQDVDFDGFRRIDNRLELTLELAHSKHFLMHQTPRSPDDNLMILASPEDDVCTAALAKAAGFNGISLFNFAYYRVSVFQTPGFDNRHEPPFDVVARLKQPDLAPLRWQSWFLGTVYTQGFKGAQMPAAVGVGHPARLTLRAAAIKGHWAEGGVLRFVARKDGKVASTGGYVVTLNGHPLDPADPNHARVGNEDAGLPFRSYAFPSQALIVGDNHVLISVTDDAACEIALLEVLIPAAA